MFRYVKEVSDAVFIAVFLIILLYFQAETTCTGGTPACWRELSYFTSYSLGQIIKLINKIFIEPPATQASLLALRSQNPDNQFYITMRQSKLFTKTQREAPKDEVSLNAQLLIRAGFVDKLMAGVYTYLPLGLRVLDKIKNIIREEINAVGGQEILMPALNPKENWVKTGRWDGLDVLFRLEGAGGKEYALGASHEEVVTPLVQRFANSYKDLPVAVYQIQDKFRNEPRAKSGLLRGREFSMKDLYSFHANEKDLDGYYEKVKAAYLKIYERCGLGPLTHVVFASGGTFSKYSHEFQTITEYGEDTIFVCSKCGTGVNKEIIDEQKHALNAAMKNWKKKSIEVGNIFKLKTKYSAAFDYKYTDEKGRNK